MTILIQSLSDLKSSQKLCEVDVDNPQDTIFCQIVDFDDDLTLVRKILADNGDFDGYSIIFTHNIKNLIWEGELLQQLEILLEDRKKESKSSIDKISNIKIDNDFFKIVKRINSLFGYISVFNNEDSNDFYFGQVKDIDEYYILMKLMGDKSSMDDRNIVIRLEDIGRIDFGGIYDENMLKLHYIKKKIRSS